MIARRHFCFSLGLACLPAWSADAAAQFMARVRQRLADEPVLRGAFEQRKTVKGFRNPLVSSGEFVVARQRGVLWRTTAPFPSLLVVTRDRVLAKQGDGSVARRLSASDEPAVRAISETLFGVMAADLSVLAQRFEVTGEMTAEGWRLVLLPREPQLARWIQRVELDGDRFLHAVRMHQAGGDLTQLRLAWHATGARLAAEEEAQFE